MLRDKTNTFAAASVLDDKKKVNFADNDFSTPTKSLVKGYPVSYTTTEPSLNVEVLSSAEPSMVMTYKTQGYKRHSIIDMDSDDSLSLFSEWQRESKDSAFSSELMLEHYVQIKNTRVSPFSLQRNDSHPDEEEEKNVQRPVARLGHRLSH